MAYQLVTIAALAAAVPGSFSEQVQALDRQLFEKGFNECDLGAMEQVVDPDVQFYHDLAGLDVGRTAFLSKVRANICSGKGAKPIRRPVPNTMSVHPLYREGTLYGVIQNGEHSFFLRDDKGSEELTNVGRYSHLWLMKEGAWKLANAYSFDHLDPRSNGRFEADVLTKLFDRREHIERALATHGVESMSIARIENGAVVEKNAFGRASRTAPARPDTIYVTASLAKPVSTLLALTLAEKGLWSLDEPLAPHFVDPEIAKDPRAGRVTTRHVLAHRSGLPNWRYLEPSSKLAFLSQPGTKTTYSGEGFEWMRSALEAKFKTPFEELVRQHVLLPLEMKDSSFVWPDQVPLDRVADRYDTSGKLVEMPRHRKANAAANFMTTATDYGRLLSFVMSGSAVSAEMRKQMFTPTGELKPGIDMGLGWEIVRGLSDGGFAIQHGGGDPGVKAFVVGFPKDGRGLVMLSNSDNAPVLWQKILTETFGRDGAALSARNMVEPSK